MIYFKLKELMKKRGYADTSYRFLAQELKVSHVALWLMINNKKYNPSLQVLDRLCEFFKCKPGDLLEYEKPKKKK